MGYRIDRYEDKLVYHITGSRKASNLFWAIILFLGSLGLFLVGISSYLGMDVFFLSEEISDDFPFIPDCIYLPFIPQGVTMAFYGSGGLGISFYFWGILFWNVGGGYDIFDKTTKKVSFWRWGFPGKNRKSVFEIPMDEIQSIRIITTVKEEGIFTRILTYDSIVYMETIEQGFIPLTRSEDDLLPPIIAQKAGELSSFLGVPLLY
uniref:pafII n=1 Tax=Erythrina sandwicensis TaxID=2590719 RepID=UPI0026E34ABC|nr:pafII [Erythrina sandwicensis]WJK72508.1 pafII [Erythrina sandwicensis]